MKTREEIKLIARIKLADQRTSAICAGLIVYGISLLVSMTMFLTFIPIIGIVAFFATIAVTTVLAVTYAGFFVKLYRGERVSAESVLDGLKYNFSRKFGSMFCVGLFTCLWSILFYIPGIIKAYSYSFTAFILTEFPKVGAMDAITVSRKLTNGHKMELFVLDLSFIGWWILNMFTAGILGVVHVIPYANTAHAGYYTEILNQKLANGEITYAELGVEDKTDDRATYNYN